MSETPATTQAKPARTYPARRQNVPDFARFEGTSAWKKYRHRARAYARFQGAAKAAAPASTPHAEPAT